MALGDDFRRLADAHVQRKNAASKRRKELGSKWEEAKGALKAICTELTAAAGEYKDFAVGFNCVNGECVLSMGFQGGESCALKFRLDVDQGKIVVTDTVGGIDHAFDIEPFDDLAVALEDRVSHFQEAFFKSLEAS